MYIYISTDFFIYTQGINSFCICFYEGNFLLVATRGARLSG